MSLTAWSAWADDAWDGWAESATTDPDPDPVVVVREPYAGGWLMRPLKRQEEAEPQELESVRPETEISPVVTPAVTAATHTVITDPQILYKGDALMRIEQAARDAFLEEQARLMSLEAARRAKKRRAEEMLLLLT